MVLDTITLDRIKLMHPKVRQELLEQYTYINEKILGKGVRLRFAYTYRSPEEQHQLFKQKPKVTNADSWQSIHQYGLAFDIVMLYDNDGNGSFEEASWSLTKDGDKDTIADWKEVADYFKSKGWIYGGDWKSFKDHPHFEKTFDNTWKDLKIKIDSKQFKIEIINGQSIKYVNI